MIFPYSCLIVDDEPDILELLAITLERMDVYCVTAETVQEAKKQLSEKSFQLCLTDMKLPDGNGIELVTHIQKYYSEIPVAIITAHGNMESAITALKSGAFDFISKPVDLVNLRNIVSSAIKLHAEQDSAEFPEEGIELIGDSLQMRKLNATINKLAHSQAPVHIFGESGTGKELVARLIHARGPRASGPFVPVNCGAIPSDLMETEFFGHKRGSFSGAISDKPGLFVAAQEGTLFLDEIADLPLHMQVKLLRAIQEKQIRPVGAQKEIHLNVRILSATHKDLSQLVQLGQFRQDLFYRINVIELKVPPLRDHYQDISLLSHKIICKIKQSYSSENPRLSERAIKALKAYPFPGNVRELENILERALTLCEGEYIEPDDLRLPEQELKLFSLKGSEWVNASLDPMLEHLQRETILEALQKTQGNKTKAAKVLGITFSTLRYRMQKLNLDDK